MTLIECFSGAHVDNMAACLRLKPEKMVMVGSGEDMAEALKDYEKILALRGQNTRIQAEDVSGKDIGQLCAFLHDLIRQEQECVIDITGGDEPVILAVGAVLVSLGKENFHNIRVEKYDHEARVVRDCLHDNKPVAGKQVELTVEEMIGIHGGSVTADTAAEPAGVTLQQIDPLWRIASRDPKGWNHAVKDLNEFESRFASGDQVYLPLNYLRRGISKFDEKETRVRTLLEQLHNCGAVNNRSSHSALDYTYTSAIARYCTWKAGNVLELKTLLEARKALREDGRRFQDCRMGVSIDWDGERYTDVGKLADTRNEIDVLLVYGVTPLFISCKNGDVKEDELYKLNEVASRFGGPHAKKMLIATDLDQGKPAANRFFNQRAWDMDIVLVGDAAELTPGEWNEIFWDALK